MKVCLQLLHFLTLATLAISLCLYLFQFIPQGFDLIGTTPKDRACNHKFKFS